jgi:hypothetical protein
VVLQETLGVFAMAAGEQRKQLDLLSGDVGMGNHYSVS